jgi:hypothetical protein
VSRITGKIFLASFLFFLVAHVSVADAVSRAGSAKQFAEDVQRSVPFSTLTPLDWSDSYIGQLVSRRPHFGVGVSYGMVVADFSAARDLLNDFGTTAYMDMGGVMMPSVYGHVRIGGFFVPFDIGIMASIPIITKPADGFVLKQQTLGCDVRFALSRDDTKMPGISLGIAYTQTTGLLSTKVSSNNIGIHWSGNAVEIKVQISKTLWVFTPYFGGGGSFTWSRAGYDVTGGLTEEWGMESDNFTNGVIFRIFGGTSVNLRVFRLDFSVNLSIPNFEYGVVVGTRFQL